jgi:hypothetical protein
MQRLTTTQRGVDIVALDQETGQQFFIEAKGNTSSRKGSKRFGQPYTQSQVFDRVAKGVFTCLRLRAEYPDRDDTHVVLAVPDGTRFRAYLTPVLQSLQEAGIEVWFEPVKGTGSSE